MGRIKEGVTVGAFFFGPGVSFRGRGFRNQMKQAQKDPVAIYLSGVFGN